MYLVRSLQTIQQLHGFATGIYIEQMASLALFMLEMVVIHAQRGCLFLCYSFTMESVWHWMVEQTGALLI